MYASSRDIRFTKKEAKRFIHILVQSMEFTIINDIVVDIAAELHNIFIRKSNTSTKSFNSIINRIKKFPTDFRLDMNFVSKKGNYYHRAYGKGLGDEGKQYLYNEMKNQLIISMNEVWSNRNKIQMVIKMSESGVPSYIIHDLVSFMKQNGCIDIDINKYEDSNNEIKFDIDIDIDTASELERDELLHVLKITNETLSSAANSIRTSNIVFIATNDLLVETISASKDLSADIRNLSNIVSEMDNRMNRIEEMYNRKIDPLIDTSQIVRL